MASITIQEAQGQFTKAVMAVYKERVPAPSFLRSFFPSAPPTAAKLVSVFVQRGTEKVAVDVSRGSQGNRNQWSRSTEKMFEPLYYRENFDLTSLQFYDRYWGSAKDGSISDAVLGTLINSVVENQQELVDKIERSIEVMCAQILKTGKIVSFAGGTGIEVDFKRKAESIVDHGVYWGTNTTDPFEHLELGGIFLRQYGKMKGNVINAICGREAINALKKNTIFQDRQKMFSTNWDNVMTVQKNATGAAYHGWIEAGTFIVNLWSYPEYYQDPDNNNAMTPYVDEKYVVLLPNDANFKTAFGAPPQVLEPGQAPKVGQFIFSDYVSTDKRSHTYDVESCPLPVPVAIDQIYTLKAVAG